MVVVNNVNVPWDTDGTSPHSVEHFYHIIPGFTSCQVYSDEDEVSQQSVIKAFIMLIKSNYI